MDERTANIAARLGAIPSAPERRGGRAVVRLYALRSAPRSRAHLITLARCLIADWAAQIGKDPPALSEDAVRYLCTRSWAHEQFAACLRRAVAGNRGSLITAADLEDI